MTNPLISTAYHFLLQKGRGEEDEPHHEEEHHEEGHVEEHESHEMTEKEIENFTFWVSTGIYLVAAMNAIRYGFEIIFWRTPKDYYKNGLLGRKEGSFTNWWEKANYVYLRGAFFIWVLASVSQMLSIFKVAPQFNQLVWEWGVMYALGLLSLFYTVMSLLSYEQAFLILSKDDYKISKYSWTEYKVAWALIDDLTREWTSYAI